MHEFLVERRSPFFTPLDKNDILCIAREPKGGKGYWEGCIG
nr:hypothetical protein [Arthrospira sp. PLM2.Bin9]